MTEASYVVAALRSARLPARGVELTGMIARYPALRAAVDALYLVPAVDETGQIGGEMR